MSFLKCFKNGMNWTQGFLAIGLMLLVGLSAYVLIDSLGAQQAQAKAFDGWESDRAGHEKVMKIQAETGEPVIVYFYADWCPHCQRFKKELLSNTKVREALAKYPRVKIAPDNGEAEKALMGNYGAEGFPTFYVTHSGFAVEVSPMAENEPRMKTPEEFIQAVEAAANEKDGPEANTPKDELEATP